MAADRSFEWKKFFASLSLAGKLRLLTGVFLLSAPGALLHDLAMRGHGGWGQVAAWSIGIGLLAATSVHEALVPPVSFATDHFEIHGDSQPATEMGGDLVDVVRAHGRIGIYVADVAGHGVPAGVMMSMIKSAIRMRLRAAPPLTDLVRDLNEVLLEVGRPGAFATFAGLELDGARRLEYCNAGHPSLLHCRAATRIIERYESDGPPLGVVAGFTFGSRTVDLAPGDLVAVLTDGLTEVLGTHDEEFGEERLAEVLSAHAGKPLREIHAAILDAVRRFGPQRDDQTLLLVRALAAPAAGSRG